MNAIPSLCFVCGGQEEGREKVGGETDRKGHRKFQNLGLGRERAQRGEGNDLRASRGGSRLMPSAFPQQRFGLRILGETWRVHSTLAGSVNLARVKFSQPSDYF